MEKELSMNDFLTEAEVMEFMGILNKPQLDRLRHQENLPYIRVRTTIRMYYVPDVLNWLSSRRRHVP